MQLELINGETVKVDANVTALTLFNLQREKVINGDFLKGFMKSSENDMDLDPIAVLQAVYAAYRQANQKDPLSYESFLANYQLDMETDIEIYFAVISKQSRKLFQKNFVKGVKQGKK